MEKTPKAPAARTAPLAQGARMVRKQILITTEQSRAMKALAASTGRTEADLFREAVDAKLAADDGQDWKAALLAAAAEWPEGSPIAERVADGRKGWARRQARLWATAEDK
jgi:predicted DNA-binding protein